MTGVSRQRKDVAATRKLLGAAAAFLAAALAYDRWLRGQVRNWNATAEEVEARLPGDDLLEAAEWAPRGGAYTYDWIENLLELNMHSVERVLPEFQQPQVGEGFGLGANQMRYARVEPEHVLSLRSLDGNWVWSFVLQDHGGRTRLLSRNRSGSPNSGTSWGCCRWSPVH